MIHFCPGGFYYLVASARFENSVCHYLISEPIQCSSENPSAKIISPGDIAKTAALLNTLSVIGPTFSYHDLLYHELSVSIETGNLQKAKILIDSALERFLTIDGHNPDVLKSNCIHLVFILHRLIDEHNHFKNTCIWTKQHTHDLLHMNSIGELKTFVNKAGDRFLERLFQPTFCKHHLIIQKILSLLEKNYTNRITQNQVAHQVYLSPSHFSKIFNEAMGMTFNQYLNHLRIEKAKELLKQQNIDINTVYNAVGFENRSYFGKVFKALAGITPGQYRNQSVK